MPAGGGTGTDDVRRAGSAGRHLPSPHSLNPHRKRRKQVEAAAAGRSTNPRAQAPPAAEEVVGVARRSRADQWRRRFRPCGGNSNGTAPPARVVSRQTLARATSSPMARSTLRASVAHCADLAWRSKTALCWGTPESWRPARRTRRRSCEQAGRLHGSLVDLSEAVGASRQRIASPCVPTVGWSAFFRGDRPRARGEARRRGFPPGRPGAAHR